MTPYLLMVAVPGVLAFVTQRHSRITLLIVTTLFWLTIGFRFKVGADWDSYLQMYLQQSETTLTEIASHQEPGFRVLLWLGHRLGGGLILVNAVSALAFCWGLYAVAKRCREPFLALVVATPLMVIASAMNLTRQSAALGIIMYLYATWENRRVLSRVALVLVASLFHFSAVFVMIFVALSARTTAVVRVAAALVVALLIWLIIWFVPESMESYSRLYLSGRIDAPAAFAHVGAIAAAAIAYLLFRKRWTQANGDNPLLLNLAIAALVAVPAVLITSVGAFRFSIYLWPMAMYVWSGFPGAIGAGTGRALYRLLIVSGSVALLVIWLTLANNSRYWIPYRNWLLEPATTSVRKHFR